MARPQNLDDAKALIRQEKARLGTAFGSVIGSRWLLAIAAAFALAFASHVIYAPQRLPPVGGISAAAVGLPTNLDWGLAGEQAQEAAAAAARREQIPGRIETMFDERVAADPGFIPLLNKIGLGAALALLAVNLFTMTKRRRYTRG